MSEIANILLAFQDALNTNELSWAELRIGPVQLNSRENICYIEAGPTIEYEEKGNVRLHATEIIISAQRTATNRNDIAGIDETAEAVNAILDSIDSNKAVQTACTSLRPVGCETFYDDKEGLQSMKLEIIYRVQYSRNRKRP